MAIYKGVLIDQSVSDPREILDLTNVTSSRTTKLEGEAFRGEVTFHNIEVDEKDLWTVLDNVASSIKKPGWYFHLVNKDRLYIVMPHAVLFANHSDVQLKAIVDYAVGQGIHPDQLNLKQLFNDPYA